MASVATAAVCCASTACCNFLCCACKACGKPAKSFPKITYLVQDFALMFVAVIMMYTLKPLYDKTDWLYCTEMAGGGSECLGISSVIRASFTISVYHFIILLAICPRARCSSDFHDSLWCIKFTVMFFVFIGTFFMPNAFFATWADFCRISSILYLIVQAYFILNQAYLWNDNIANLLNNSESSCYAGFLMLSYSILGIAGSFVWLGFQYSWFWGCGFSNTILVAVTICYVIFAVASFLRLCDIDIFRHNNSPFVAGNAMVYMTYLSWTALSHQLDEDDETCNDMYRSNSNNVWQVIIGAIFTAVTIWCVATASSESANSTSAKGEHVVGPGQDAVAEDANEQPEVEDTVIFAVTPQTLVYQLIMFFSSTYFAMLFTNWGYLIFADDTVESEYINNGVTFWVKIASLVLTVTLYTISISLNICCSDRIL